MRKNQKGAVLIVSLIMLLLLTILSVSSMQTIILEEKVTGNYKDKNTAFQAAEAALRAGESFLETVPLPNFDGTTVGLYQPTATGGSRWNIVNWSDDAQVMNYAGLAHVADQPAFIIEELLPVRDNDSSIGLGEENTFRYYRITARAVGGSDTAIVMLQSVYKRAV